MLRPIVRPSSHMLLRRTGPPIRETQDRLVVGKSKRAKLPQKSERIGQPATKPGLGVRTNFHAFEIHRVRGEAFVTIQAYLRQHIALLVPQGLAILDSRRRIGRSEH